MLRNFYYEEIKSKFKAQILIKKHGIEDPFLIDFIKNSITSDGDLYLHNIDTAASEIFQFDYDFIRTPQEIADDYAEGWEYYILAVIQIPALIPYANHPAFLEFTRQLTIVEHGCGSGNLFEFVYLPDSIMAVSDEPIYKEFALQPGTFMIGSQDNGGLDIETTINFLVQLKEINDSIVSLIEGPNERGETAA